MQSHQKCRKCGRYGFTRKWLRDHYCKKPPEISGVKMELSKETNNQITKLKKHFSEVVEDWSEEEIITLSVLDFYEHIFPAHIRIKHLEK